MADEGVVHQGKLAMTISNAVVGELASTTGRGLTQAKTTLGDNAVFVVLQDTLTRGERSLVGAGESEAVPDLRRSWQRVMRESCSRKVEKLTGRKVVRFMSDNQIDPDIAVEVFILEPIEPDPAVQAAIAVADPASGGASHSTSVERDVKVSPAPMSRGSKRTTSVPSSHSMINRGRQR